MAYTPEMSLTSSSTLRRISWAPGIPMTEAIEFVFEYLPKILDKEKEPKQMPFYHSLFLLIPFNPWKV